MQGGLGANAQSLNLEFGVKVSILFKAMDFLRDWLGVHMLGRVAP